VARSRTSLIRNDLTDAAFDQAWVAREGLRSVACLPLVTGDQLLGVMVGFFRQPMRDEVSETIGHLAALGAAALNDARLVEQEREARAVAEKAVVLRDRFLAVASHELRTPLTVVRGNWELLGRRLRSKPKDPEAHREQVDTSLRRLGQGIEQLRRLVEDLLDVNRLRGGSVELERAELDLVALIHDAVAGVPDPAGRSQIQLNLPPGPVLGWWDAGRLTQVIHNLVANALKYSPPKTSVEVSLTALEGHVVIRVSDSGIGIAPDQLAAIFEPFSRAPNASAQHYPGLGLGLAVSREIVGQLGGRIWAESSGEGQGSSFVVELQRGSASEPERAEDPT
jgi:signal transduction histidine kinase